MPEPSRGNPGDIGVLARAIGMIVSPTRTFGAVVAAPRPGLILLLVCLLFGLATGLPQLTEKGWRTTVEMQLRQQERFTGQPVSAEMRATMERRAPYSGYITFASTFVFVPIVTVIFAAILWAIFNIVLAGDAVFKQVLGIVAHAQVIAAVGAVLAAPIIVATGMQTMTGPFNLGAFVQMLDPSSFVVRFLSAINFFMLWQLVVTAMGLGVLYKRRPTGIAVFLIGVMLVLVAGFTSAFSAIQGR